MTELLAGSFALSLFIDPEKLDSVVERTLATRKAEQFAGIRLMLAADADDVARQLDSRLQSFPGDNVIRMPLTPKVENSPPRSFYVFSPQRHNLVTHMRDFARNGISGAYLLGGSGSGKTTLRITTISVETETVSWRSISAPRTPTTRRRSNPVVRPCLRCVSMLRMPHPQLREPTTARDGHLLS